MEGIFSLLITAVQVATAVGVVVIVALVFVVRATARRMASPCSVCGAPLPRPDTARLDRQCTVCGHREAAR